MEIEEDSSAFGFRMTFLFVILSEAKDLFLYRYFIFYFLKSPVSDSGDVFYVLDFLKGPDALPVIDNGLGIDFPDPRQLHQRRLVGGVDVDQPAGAGG